MRAQFLRIVIGVLLSIAVEAKAAPPTALDDVVLFARDSLRVDLGTRLVSGQLVVNEPDGIATFRRSVSAYNGTQIVANTIGLRPRVQRPGPTFFDVFTNLFDPGPAGVVIQGEGPTAVSLPLFPFPTAAVAIPGTDTCPTPGRVPGDCVVRVKDGPVTILPGNYARIVVKNNAALYFAGGTYHASSIRVGGDGRVLFDGTTTLYVADRVKFGRRALVGPTNETTLSGRCIAIHSGGIDRGVLFGAISDVTATVSALNGPMKLGTFGTYRGNFTAARVDVGRNVVLSALPALAMPCP